MIYQTLINKGLLEQEQIGFDQINKALSRAYRNIKSAKILLKDDDEEEGSNSRKKSSKEIDIKNLTTIMFNKNPLIQIDNRLLKLNGQQFKRV